MQLPPQIPKDISVSLKQADLRYMSDTVPGITRVRRGKGFSYEIHGETIHDKEVVQRIYALRIPPAWENVWISPRENSHIQATGRDEKGRKQYIYHTEWNRIMQQNKFHKMVFFGEVLPEIRREVTAGMQERGLTQRRVISTVVWLLGKTFIRVGNEEYAQENKSYGLTTMRMKHVDVSGDKVSFEFKGKSGKYHAVEVEHPRVAKTIKKLEELPGYELFQYVDNEGNRHLIDSSDINSFLKSITGDDITAKDFRTWGGTVYAADTLYHEGPYTSQTDAKKKISCAVKLVSKHLGNTTTVCRTYYIHPTVITTYEKNELISSFEEWKEEYTLGRNLSKSEFLVHKLIKRHA